MAEAELNDALPVTGNTEITRPENRAFYPALDGFRAVAFLMVFVWHYAHVPWAWAGVNLFFVLSGFLITGILLDTRDHPHWARNFYVRRTLRIFPLYYGVMLLIVLAWPVAHWKLDWRWLAWPAYIVNFLSIFRFYPGSDIQLLAEFKVPGIWHGHHTMLALGHFWSLCVEEQFYLVWPWVVFYVRSQRRLLWICGLAPVVCLILRTVCLHTLPTWAVEQDAVAHLTPFRLDDLIVDGFLALLIRGPRRDVALRVGRFAAPTLLLLALLAAVLFLRSPSFWLQHAYPADTQGWGMTLIQVISGLVILSALQESTWVYRFLALRPLRWAGRLSYGAYVFHDIFHVQYRYLADRLLPGKGQVLATVLALLVTYLLAWLSFKFYETPFLNLKERWTVRS